HDEVAIDRLVRAQVRQGTEPGQPTLAGVEPGEPSGLGGVGPLGVVAMLAGRGREDGVLREELGEELGEGGVEVGHARKRSGRGVAGARRRYHRPMPAQTWVEPVVLEGSRVRMEPLSMAHFGDLAAVAFDLPIWQWTIMGPQDEAGLRRWIESALANAEAGTERPFATIDLASGRAVGSSRYMSIVPEHKRLEIGWTWLAT